MAKKRFTVTISPGDYEELRRWAEAKGDEAASIASYLVQRGIEVAKDKGEIPERGDVAEQAETLELLLGFLNYLIDHFDHDGYSLSEISKLLGRPDDKGLVNLVQKLQNGQNQPQPKSGAKTK